eukprot:scaffold82353_cov30-Prasinocladus_malaysianus.AAC.2
MASLASARVVCSNACRALRAARTTPRIQGNLQIPMAPMVANQSNQMGTVPLSGFGSARTSMGQRTGRNCGLAIRCMASKADVTSK